MPEEDKQQQYQQQQQLISDELGIMRAQLCNKIAPHVVRQKKDLLMIDIIPSDLKGVRDNSNDSQALIKQFNEEVLKLADQILGKKFVINTHYNHMFDETKRLEVLKAFESMK